MEDCVGRSVHPVTKWNHPSEKAFEDFFSPKQTNSRWKDRAKERTEWRYYQLEFVQNHLARSKRQCRRANTGGDEL